MLLTQTMEKLRTLGLQAMADALAEQMAAPAAAELPFEDRIGLLVDREWDARESRRLQRRLKGAKLKQPAACIEDIDFRGSRGLDRGVLLALASGHWITAHQNCIVTGPTGAGKTFVACALGHRACRLGHSVAYHRVSRLLADLALARAAGTLGSLTRKLAKTELLLLDDWALTTLTIDQAQDLLDVLEDRAGVGSTLIATQVPVSQWHARIGDPTIADAILDRLVHGAHRIELRGESMRKLRARAEAAERPEETRREPKPADA
jgi:DNA replication protein DnaC